MEVSSVLSALPTLRLVSKYALKLSADSTESPSWMDTHHRGASRLRFFSRAADELVTSIAEFNYEDQLSVLYTFSRDSKLRTWSSMTGNCLKSVDVRTMIEGSHGSPSSQRPRALVAEQTPSVIRVVPHPNPSSRCSHVVVVFVPTPYDPSIPGTFVFFRASNTSSGANDLEYAGSRPGSSASAGSQLRGFEVQPPTRTDAADGWRLWAVWDSKGTLSADSVQVNDILQFTNYIEPQFRPPMVFDWQKALIDNPFDRFDNSYFDNLIDLEAADPVNPFDNEDITLQFIEHLFYPGRFSVLTLTTSLEDFIDQLPGPVQNKLHTSVYPSLSKRFEAAVGSTLMMETSSQTGAPEVVKYRKDLKQQWQGIWARVRELDKQARWPVSTASVNGQLVILDRDGASVPVEEDTPCVLVHLGKSNSEATEFQSLPEGSLRAIYPALAPPQTRRALTALTVAGEGLSAILESREVETSTGSALEALVDALDGELAAGLQEPVEVIATRLWEERIDPHVQEDERASLDRALAESSSVVRTLSEALDILATSPIPSTVDRVANDAVFSGFGNALLTSTVAAVVASRFAFIRDVLVTGLYHLSVSEDDEDDLIEVLARTFATYHRYRVLQWVCEQTGEEAAERSRARRLAKRLRGKDDVLADFETLKMREGDDEPQDVDGYNTSYSLLHSLLARVMPQSVPVDTVACLFDSACAFLADLDLLEPEQIDIEPRDPDVKLAYAVLADGHAAAARQMTELYPLSSGLAFVRGRALLEGGEVEEGVRHLELASAGVRGKW
jgi:nuclear pore complex protein Nup160